MTFDRYLLRSFFHCFAVCFTALLGLVVVIDLLENLDEFIDRNEGRGWLSLLERIAWFYGYQSFLFLDRGGPALTIVSVVVVLILFQRSGELHPLLAAGVPMWRVLSPLVFAAFVVNGALIVNQEFIVPRFAYYALEGRGVSSKQAPPVESAYDHLTRITIDGKKLLPAERTILDAEFLLPAPALVDELTTLRAERAVFRKGQRGEPTGWYLFEIEPEFADLRLTERGAKFVRDEPRIAGAFVATALTPDQLYKRSSSYSLLSSRELLARIRNPAFGPMSAHRLVLHLHSRFVQPLLNLIGVIISIPLMVRRESTGLVIDSALCSVMQGLLFAAIQACQFLAGGNWLPPDLGAWLPVIFGGCLAVLLSNRIRT
jgi:lipopolysaccharide export system permease protein